MDLISLSFNVRNHSIQFDFCNDGTSHFSYIRALETSFVRELSQQDNYIVLIVKVASTRNC